MKHLFTLLVLGTLVCSASQAQTINGIPVKNSNATCMRIISTAGAGGNVLSIDLDFGKKSNLSSGNRKPTLLDAAGNVLKFEDMVDALNFMIDQGYDFVQAYAYTNASVGIVTVYLMKKRK